LFGRQILERKREYFDRLLFFTLRVRILPIMHITILTCDNILAEVCLRVLEKEKSSAGQAKDRYYNCSRFNVAAYVPSAINDTKYLLARSEHAVAGILNRYYFYGWLNS
jgi:hypothetical protein